MISVPESLFSDVDAALSLIQGREVIERIWRKDHTVWKPDSGNIANRLGWLSVAGLMREKVPALVSFADEVRESGFRHVVLLGMGGSSLCAEVLRQSIGSAAGYPELIVLDSTVPAWVQAVADSIEPSKTLFLVSSKSGGTTETLYFYKYFRYVVERSVGKERAGKNFVAITDAGTPLARLADEAGFRKSFLNPADIGGRYSVLSYFGLVPVALAGVDIMSLLERAEVMEKKCHAGVPARENAGAVLGAAIGAGALQGKDKLTLVVSPAISSFGLWLEQLIAESLGKEGKGIVPVVGEPLLPPDDYGDDRLFVCLRLEGDDNTAVDDAVAQIKASGKPVMTIKLKDCYDLGAEFFRWEFAVAVAGAIMAINPFDQPDVQAAKEATRRVLDLYRVSGKLPPVTTTCSFIELLSSAGHGDYLAIMVYMLQTPELDKAMADLRLRVMEHYRIATTVGYGPRLLHSTGQLHKGGPNTGLFVQITADHEKDMPVPGEPYTFGVLADAQALGDFQALQALGRRVIRIHTGSGGGAVLERLVGKTV